MKDYLEGFVGDEDPIYIWLNILEIAFAEECYQKLISLKSTPWLPNNIIRVDSIAKADILEFNI